MNLKGISVVAAGMLAAPALTSAAEPVDEAVTIYGKVHLSADAYDNDAGATGGIDEESGLGISSNASRVGLKGTQRLREEIDLVWQLEQEVNFDAVAGDTFATRNSFLGFKSGAGTVLAGYYDTPFKDVGSAYTIFGDTVADRRAILGAFVGQGNRMNDRGANALMYVGDFGPVEIRAMYGADQSGSSGEVDDNSNDLVGASAAWKAGPLSLAVAYEDQKDVFGGNEAQGIRVGAGYTFGNAKAQAIYETITSDDSNAAERDAFGVNGTLPVADKTTLGAQVLLADDHEGTGNTGATMASVGATREVDVRTDVYLVYSMTDNDSAADYQGADGGHGDEIRTDLGGDPSVLSLGATYSF